MSLICFFLVLSISVCLPLCAKPAFFYLNIFGARVNRYYSENVYSLDRQIKFTDVPTLQLVSPARSLSFRQCHRENAIFPSQHPGRYARGDGVAMEGPRRERDKESGSERRRTKKSGRQKTRLGIVDARSCEFTEGGISI